MSSGMVQVVEPITVRPVKHHVLPMQGKTRGLGSYMYVTGTSGSRKKRVARVLSIIF